MKCVLHRWRTDTYYNERGSLTRRTCADCGILDVDDAQLKAHARIAENERLRQGFDAHYEFLIKRKGCDDDAGDYSNAQISGQKSLLRDLKKWLTGEYPKPL